jgi:hypothetical protein
VNQQTGERTFQYPGPGSQQQGGYGGQQGGYGGPQGGYGGPQGGYGGQQGGYNQGYGQQQAQPQKSGGNGWKYAAAGVAGVAGGALLMHEGDDISTSRSTCPRSTPC